MDLEFKLRDHLLVAEISGKPTLREAVRVCMLACDGAAERSFSTFLMDASSVNGELSISERHDLGRTVADYCVAQGRCYHVALVGTEPAVTGFGALVASNRGLLAVHFRDLNLAVEWVNAFTRDLSRWQRSERP
jgi:hypothetical protein